MWWRGHAVVDVDKVPLRDFKNLPSTLANSCEGGLMEAVERLDSRVKHRELFPSNSTSSDYMTRHSQLKY